MLAEAGKWADAGYKESGQDRTIFGQWYGMDGVAWCDMFVSYCGDKSGNADVIGKFAYCPSHVQFFKNKGQWLERDADVLPGDIVFFKWPGSPYQGADHIEIVTAASRSPQPVATVGGNTGPRADGVYRQTYNRGVILGYGRPAYVGQGDVPSPNPVKQWFKLKAPMTVAAAALALGVSTDSIIAETDPNFTADSQLTVGTVVAGTKTPAGAGFVAVKNPHIYPGPADVKFGVQNDYVVYIDKALIKAGYGKYFPDGPSDKYDTSTLLAVRDFQKDQGWSTDGDGDVGPVTWERLKP